MRRSMTGNIEQKLLYRYIGMEFDAVAGMSESRIDGDAEAFLAQLYHRRMASVFGGPIDEKAADAQSLKEVVARLDEVHQRQGDDLLPVKLDKIEVNDDRERPVDGGEQDRAVGEGRFDQEGDLGIEAYATYLPIHFFPREFWKKDKPGWGIYVSEAGVRHVAGIIEHGFVRRYGSPREDDRPGRTSPQIQGRARHRPGA